MSASTKAEEFVNEAKTILRNAELDGRDVTPQERGRVEELLGKATALRDRSQVEELALQALEGQPNDRHAQPWARGVDPGRAFVESEGYKRIAHPETRGQRWSTGAVPVGAFQTKGTLLEGAGAPGSGTGGGLLPVPQADPGVVEKLLTAQLDVAGLFGSFTTDTSTVRYVVEGTATSAATGVAEAATKPESTLGLSTTDANVKKIATVVTVSDELLEDARATQGFVGGRLQAFVRVEEEKQLLRGGGSDDLQGIVGTSGVLVHTRGTADNNAIELAKVIANVRGSSFVEPDAIVLNPANWLTTRLLQDDNNQFYGGGPFSGAYSQAGAAPMFGQMLWNKKVVLSDQIGAGTAIVGNFGQAAAIARRTGPTVEASNSDGDNFRQDLVTIRCEQREALLIYRPAAFCVVSNLA